jgi:hypothetical protein
MGRLTRNQRFVRAALGCRGYPAIRPRASESANDNKEAPPALRPGRVIRAFDDAVIWPAMAAPGRCASELSGKGKPAGRAPSGREAMPPRDEPQSSRSKRTKQARLVAMLARPRGATVEQICRALGWQPHTVRGAIAGTVKKKLSLRVKTTRNADGTRTYRIR